MDATTLREWNPRDDNMADLFEAYFEGIRMRDGRYMMSLRMQDLTETDLLVLHDAVTEELQMRGVSNV